MNNENNHLSVFNRSGLASIEDLRSPQWKSIYLQLENDQKDFLLHENKFRSKKYKNKWPSDALHWWSRIWEYPYVMHHIEHWHEKSNKQKKLKVVDFGSGVTFFPFSIARLGLDVCCVDNDEICGRDLAKAINTISTSTGSVTYKIISGSQLPFGDNEVDVLYSISVLEHIPNFEKTIVEMNRILKPGGLCILTIDLDLLGNSEIGSDKYEYLRSLLLKYFHYLAPDRTIHPDKILKSNAGPFPMPMASAFLYLKGFTINRIIKPLLLRKGKETPSRKLLFAVHGFILGKNKVSQ
jgi:2-polyprenyl-3-methyl-5-hydroxy-6-metoxy-1,4-benzoquinol methylase